MKPIMLVDVMNSKSSMHRRHSENFFNLKELSKYYAIESRIYNSIWDENREKFVKGPLWFTNLMVFDFDFDESHFPSLNDYEKELNNSLNKLISILGNPKYIIKNRENFTKNQIDEYFTKILDNGDRKVNLPKKYGCQVVYALKDSVKSQYPEMVNLYRSIRLKISSLVNADMNFKGHMFKNYLNRDLFDVEEIDNDEKIDIFEVALKLGYDKNYVNSIFSLKPFEKIDALENIPKIFINYANKIIHFYNYINTWKFDGFNDDKSYQNNSFEKSSSRNVTLFNFLKSLNLNDAKNVNYNYVKNLDIFDLCNINDDISMQEFESTKQSVILYREKNFEFDGVNSDNFGIDFRVFKENQHDLNLDCVNELCEKFKKAIDENKFNIVELTWKNCKFNVLSFKNNNDVMELSNIFLRMDPSFVLFNLRNLITPDFFNLINDHFNRKYDFLGLFSLIKLSIYMVHFKYYAEIQKYRHSNKNILPKNHKQNDKNKFLKNFGFNFKGNIKYFGYFYHNLERNNLLKNDGNPKPISFYQSYFHVKNIKANGLVILIKKYVKYIQIMHYFKIFKNNSHSNNIIINIFNIDDNDNNMKVISYNDDLFMNRIIIINNIIIIKTDKFYCNKIYNAINNYLIAIKCKLILINIYLNFSFNKLNKNIVNLSL